MASCLLTIDALTLASREGYIVNDFSLCINRGEIIALTGISGSGKTSVAMAILGLLSPGVTVEEGRINWTSTDLSLSLPFDQASWSSLRGRHIGFTQQDVYGTFDPVLTMGKQMMMVVSEQSGSDDEPLEKNIRTLMEEVGLQDIDRLWHSYPHELSGGQLQRCQICIAVANHPELLITDEPTSAIDKINQVELLEVFAGLRKKYHLAILCITHEPAVVKYLADREIRLGPVEGFGQENVAREQIPIKDGQQPVLSVEQLTYQYRFGGLLSKKGALVGPLDFSILPGHCLGIIGESGSGKSTLALLMVGLLEPTSGQFHLDGTVADFRRQKDIRRLRSYVQLVMQDGRGSLHPGFTVRRILQEVLVSNENEPGSFEETINKALRDVSLPLSILDRRPETLSGGECLRVSIARALLLNPRVLICDESTSGLDTVTRDGILDLFRQLMLTRSLAILFISHDVHLIRQLADDVLVMAEGQIAERGALPEVINHPKHPATKKIFSIHATPSEKSGL